VQQDGAHQSARRVPRPDMTHVTPAGASAEAVLDRFTAAVNRHDLSAALALTSNNCVFEAPGPPPAGERSIGHTELEVAWKAVIEDPSSHFTIEESFTAGESFMAGTRVVQRWRFDWAGGFVCGVELVTVRDGLITEKLAYVKG
jgi:ketosteroid isomerase-like protein